MGDLVQAPDDVTAFKHSVKSLPQWSLGVKLPSAMDQKNRLPTEPASRGDLKKELEATKLPAQPCYSIGSREAGLLPPPKQPGPGHYKIPTTLDATHPTETMTGRGFSWGTTGRSSWGSKGTPSPMHYRVNSEPSLRKAPGWTAGGRPKDPDLSEKETRPGCQKYKVGNVVRDGPLFAPSWTLGPRRSQISSTRSTWPGPDRFNPPMEANGRRDRKPKWTLYSTERFKPLTKDRYPPY